MLAARKKKYKSCGLWKIKHYVCGLYYISVGWASLKIPEGDTPFVGSREMLELWCTESLEQITGAHVSSQTGRDIVWGPVLSTVSLKAFLRFWKGQAIDLTDSLGGGLKCRKTCLVEPKGSAGRPFWEDRLALSACFLSLWGGLGWVWA